MAAARALALMLSLCCAAPAAGQEVPRLDLPIVVLSQPDGPTVVLSRPDGPIVVLSRPDGPIVVLSRPDGPIAVLSRSDGPIIEEPYGTSLGRWPSSQSR